MRLDGGSNPPLPQEAHLLVSVLQPDGAVSCRLKPHSNNAEVNRRSKQPTKVGRSKQRGRK